MSESKSSLLEAARKLLCESERSLESIAVAIDVKYAWLVRVKAGSTPEPGVVKVQALYEHLSGKPLAL